MPRRCLRRGVAFRCIGEIPSGKVGQSRGYLGRAVPDLNQPIRHKGAGDIARLVAEERDIAAVEPQCPASFPSLSVRVAKISKASDAKSIVLSAGNFFSNEVTSRAGFSEGSLERAQSEAAGLALASFLPLNGFKSGSSPQISEGFHDIR